MFKNGFIKGLLYTPSKGVGTLLRFKKVSLTKNNFNSVTSALTALVCGIVEIHSSGLKPWLGVFREYFQEKMLKWSEPGSER